MLDCWKAEPEERPSFKQLVTRMEEMMTRDSPYFDPNKDLWKRCLQHWDKTPKMTSYLSDKCLN